MKRTEFHQLKEGAIISGINSAFKVKITHYHLILVNLQIFKS